MLGVTNKWGSVLQPRSSKVSFQDFPTGKISSLEFCWSSGAYTRRLNGAGLAQSQFGTEIREIEDIEFSKSNHPALTYEHL